MKEEISRKIAKQNIIKIQVESIRTYNKRRKEAPVYKAGDVVFIQGLANLTQGGPGLKLKPNFLGPYEVSKAKGHDRYEVSKLGDGEGSYVTTTATDFMKPYKIGSSGTKEGQDDWM